MSEQESTASSTEEETEDVELHRKKFFASDEARDTESEGDGDDDVELHGKNRKTL